MHHNYLFPCMDEVSYLLEKIVDFHQQLPSPNPPLVDELVNMVPSLVNLVDQVANPVPSSINSVDQVFNLVPSSVNIVDQVIDPSTSSVDPVHQVIDSISPLVDPTPLLKSEDVAQVFLVTTDSSG
jgi:hypothetical protein